MLKMRKLVSRRFSAFALCLATLAVFGYLSGLNWDRIAHNERTVKPRYKVRDAEKRQKTLLESSVRTHQVKTGRNLLQRRYDHERRIRRDITTFQDDIIVSTVSTTAQEQQQERQEQQEQEQQQMKVDEPIMSHIILSLPDDETDQTYQSDQSDQTDHIDDTDTVEKSKFEAGPRSATSAPDKNKAPDLGPPFSEGGDATSSPAKGMKKAPMGGMGDKGGLPGGGIGIDATPATPKKNKGGKSGLSLGPGAGPPPEKAGEPAGIDATPAMPHKKSGEKGDQPAGGAGPSPAESGLPLGGEGSPTGGEGSPTGGEGSPTGGEGLPPGEAGSPPGENMEGPTATAGPELNNDTAALKSDNESAFDKTQDSPSSETIDSVLDPMLGLSRNPLAQLTMLQDRLLKKLSELETAFKGDKMLREKTEQAAAMILAKVVELEGKIEPQSSKSDGLDRIAMILERLGPVEDKTLLMATHNLQKGQGGSHALVGRLQQMMKGYGYGVGYSGGYNGGPYGGVGFRPVAIRPLAPPFVQNNIALPDQPLSRRNSDVVGDSNYESDYAYDSEIKPDDQSSDVGSGSDDDDDFEPVSETSTAPPSTVTHVHKKHHRKPIDHEHELPTRKQYDLRGALYVQRDGYNLTLSMLKPDASLNLTEIRHPNPEDVVEFSVPIMDYLTPRGATTIDSSWPRLIGRLFGFPPKTANEAYQLTTKLLADGSMLQTEWTTWSPWTACTVTCGRGYKVRRRVCVTWLRNNCEEQRQEFHQCSKNCSETATNPTDDEDSAGW